MPAMSSPSYDSPLPTESSEIPGHLPPVGVNPNFVDPTSRGDTYTALATTIVTLMVILVTNRQYTKYFIIRKLGWDDCKHKIIHDGK